MLLTAFMVYGTIVTYVVYKNILSDNYDNISGMLDTNAESIEQSLEMIKGTAIAISGSESISNWIDNTSYFKRDSKRGNLNREEYWFITRRRILIFMITWRYLRMMSF